MCVWYNGVMSARQRHYCPKCGYDYEPWVEICPDCGVLTETIDSGDQPHLDVIKGGRGTYGPDDDPHWKVVTNMPNAIIGSLIKSQLEDAGIPVLMRRSPSADIAQFSGNDFVPQDLLVPESQEDEARELLDSSPDPGPPSWGSDYGNRFDVWDEPDEDIDARKERGIEQLRRLWNADLRPESGGIGGSRLPEGWTMLPSERDVRAQKEYQRAHGDEGGWHRLEARTNAPTDQDLYPLDTSEWQGRARYEYGTPSLPRLQRIERSDYDSQRWSGTSKWVRVCYGILLLAMSLPFLLQLVSQLFSIFR